MNIRSDGRVSVSVTMQPDLYEKLRAECRRMDVPVSVWCREAIKTRLESDNQ